MAPITSRGQCFCGKVKVSMIYTLTLISHSALPNVKRYLTSSCPRAIL